MNREGRRREHPAMRRGLTVAISVIGMNTPSLPAGLPIFRRLPTGQQRRMPYSR